MLKNILLTGILTLSGVALAQWPEKFTNLKVLPQDTSVQELRETMFAFNRALGVRCAHCHVGEDMAPLTEYDFAADDKETKQKARDMLSMVNAINKEHLAEWKIEVSCVSCHGGVTDPRPLETIMMETLEASGLAAFEERYTALRDRHYGRGRYDFGGSSLNSMAFVLEEKGMLAEAEAVHRFNLEHNPDYHHGHFKLGSFAFLKGDREEAMERFTTAHRGKPNHAPTWHGNFAWGLLRKGKGEQAMAAAEMLMTLAPKQPLGAYVVGEVFLSRGDTAAARTSFEKALNLSPGFPPAQRALGKMDGEAKGGEQ